MHLGGKLEGFYLIDILNLASIEKDTITFKKSVYVYSVYMYILKT